MNEREPNILFADNHLIAVNKPAGWVTQPCKGDFTSLEDWMKGWVKNYYQKAGDVFLQGIHRIDKPVSGIVLFAKTSKALSRMVGSIREKKCQKKYYAVVESVPLQLEGNCEHYLLHGDYRAEITRKEDPRGKLSKLSYKTIAKNKGLALLEVALETGRYHQIRIQLAALGCPIIGDAKYGAQLFFEKEMIALHHRCFSIPHPVKKERVFFEAPFPSLWKRHSFLNSFASFFLN